jgi:hypothetical protein
VRRQVATRYPHLSVTTFRQLIPCAHTRGRPPFGSLYPWCSAPRIVAFRLRRQAACSKQQPTWLPPWRASKAKYWYTAPELRQRTKGDRLSPCLPSQTSGCVLKAAANLAAALARLQGEELVHIPRTPPISMHVQDERPSVTRPLLRFKPSSALPRP